MCELIVLVLYPLGTSLLLFIIQFGSNVILAQFKCLSVLENMISGKVQVLSISNYYSDLAWYYLSHLAREKTEAQRGKLNMAVKSRGRTPPWHTAQSLYSSPREVKDLGSQDSQALHKLISKAGYRRLGFVKHKVVQHCICFYTFQVLQLFSYWEALNLTQQFSFRSISNCMEVEE